MKAQAKQKQQADKTRGTTEFAEGDMVYLATTNLDLAGVKSKKFKPRWIGPYQIVEKRSPVVYRLRLPETLGVHPVFHVSLLKAAPAPSHLSPPTSTNPPPVLVDGEPEYEVEAILGDRRRRGQPEYLLRWKGYGPEHDSWEPAAHLANAPEALDKYLNT